MGTERQTNPNIYDVHYVRAGSKGYSASRLVRYLLRRPVDKERPGPESEWRTLPEELTFGNAEAFKEAANRRRRERLESAQSRGKDVSQDHSPGNVSYLHIVLSPSRREEFSAEDFGALIEPWVRDKRGRVCPHFGVIHHDDPEGPKLHLAVARDRLHKKRELPQLKERTAEIIRERERLIDLEQRPELEPRPEPGREDEWDR